MVLDVGGWKLNIGKFLSNPALGGTRVRVITLFVGFNIRLEPLKKKVDNSAHSDR